jgi:hypothetical protein
MHWAFATTASATLKLVRFGLCRVTIHAARRISVSNVAFAPADHAAWPLSTGGK